MNQGQPLFFNVDVYLSAIDMMINADEVKRALWMMDNLPGYYRANPPAKLLEMKEQLHRKLFTPVQYKGIYKDLVITEEHTKAYWPMHAQALEDLIMEQSLGKPVHIMEYGPGSFWVPYGLVHKGHVFSYESMGLDNDEFSTLDPEKNAYSIFVSFECIEHIWQEWEIYQNYLKFNRQADAIVISTPLFTYDGGMPDWQNRELGHLQTFSPQELFDVVSKMFSGFQWECRVEKTICLIGKRV